MLFISKRLKEFFNENKDKQVPSWALNLILEAGRQFFESKPGRVALKNREARKQ